MSTLLAPAVRALNETYDGSYTTTSSDAPDIPPSSNPFPVEPGGFLVGGMLACLLYGIHISQIYTYFSRVRWRSVPSTSFGANFRTRSRGGGTSSTPLPPAAAAPLAHRLVVLWVFTLSTCHVCIVIPSGYWYFVGGLREPERWGRFYWLLSVQDGVVPLMAAAAQLYFGHRAWCLTGRKTWFRWALIGAVAITMSMGICLAVAAHEYSTSPWLSTALLTSLPIARISESFSITWMALSAFIDGSLTLILVYKFARARQSTLWSTRRVARRLMALTLETVLLTHIVGATMCIIFLANDKRHRTRNNLFWVLLEIMAELYALSVLFTVMSHERTRRGLRGDQEWGWESTITDDAEQDREEGGDADGAGRRPAEGEEDSGRNGQGGQVKHAQRRGGRVCNAINGNGASNGSSEKDGNRRPNSKKSEPRDLSQSELDRRVEGYQTRNRIEISTLPTLRFHQPKQRQQVNVVPTSRPGSGNTPGSGFTLYGNGDSDSSKSILPDSTPQGSEVGSEKTRGYSRDSTPMPNEDGTARGGTYVWHGGSTISDLSNEKAGDKDTIALGAFERPPRFDENPSALGLALGPDSGAANNRSARSAYGAQEYAYMPNLYTQVPQQPPRHSRSQQQQSPGGTSASFEPGSSETGLQLFAATPASEYTSAGLGLSAQDGNRGGLGLSLGTGASESGLDFVPGSALGRASSSVIPPTRVQPWQQQRSTPLAPSLSLLPPQEQGEYTSTPPQSVYAAPPVSPRRKGQHLLLAEEDDLSDVGSYQSALGLGMGADDSTPASGGSANGMPIPVTPSTEDNTLTPLYTYTPLGTAVPIPMIAVPGRTVSFGQAVERGILTEVEVGSDAVVSAEGVEGTPRAADRGLSRPLGKGVALDDAREVSSGALRLDSPQNTVHESQGLALSLKQDVKQEERGQSSSSPALSSPRRVGRGVPSDQRGNRSGGDVGNRTIH